MSASARRFVGQLARLIAGALAVGALSASTLAAVTPVTISVNNAGDAVADDNFCTLREAIIASNTNTSSGTAANECPAGTSAIDTINFVGRYAQINLLTVLPPIIKPVIIDGTASSRKQVRGGVSTDHIFNFDVGSAGSKLMGLTLSNAQKGVVLRGGKVTLGDNWIGTSANGLEADGMTFGVHIFSSNNVIGFIDSDGIPHGNVISGNGYGGIVILTGAKNIIQANIIGADITGAAELGNDSGIVIGGSGSGTVIGGTLPGQGNVISGNINGIYLFSTTGTQIMRNRIGLTSDGLVALPNEHGIVDNGSLKTVIGGKMPEASNFISGNAVSPTIGNAIMFDANGGDVKITGNVIGLNVAGSPVPNLAGIALYGQPAKLTIDNNLITSHTSAGIWLDQWGTMKFSGSNNCIAINAYGLTYSGNPILKFGKNWWGSITGPQNPDNPGGIGNLVSGNILFKPFLTTMPNSCYGWGAVPVSPKPNTVYTTRASQMVALKWKAVPTSREYVYVVDGIPTSAGTATSSPRLGPFTFGRHTWTVKTLSSDGVDMAGPLNFFYVTIAKTPKPEAVLRRTGKIEFSWISYPGATSYLFEQYEFGGCSGIGLTSIVSGTSIKLDAPATGTFFSWRVTPTNGPSMPCMPYSVAP